MLLFSERLHDDPGHLERHCLVCVVEVEPGGKKDKRWWAAAREKARRERPPFVRHPVCVHDHKGRRRIKPEHGLRKLAALHDLEIQGDKGLGYGLPDNERFREDNGL